MSTKQMHLDDLMPMIRAQLEQGGSVTFSPRGISMLPMLKQGRDSVMLSPLPEQLRKYDLPLYQREDGHYVLHRIVRVGETYTCIGDNQFVYECGLMREQMIAVVSAFTRKGKRASVDDPRYRAYCVLWHYSRPVRKLWRRGVGFLKRVVRRCLK